MYIYRNAQYNAVGIGKIDAIKRYLNEIIFDLRPRPTTTIIAPTTASSSTETLVDATTTIADDRRMIDIDCADDGGVSDDLKLGNEASTRRTSLINADKVDVIVLDGVAGDNGGVGPERGNMTVVGDLPIPHKTRSSSSSSHRVSGRASSSSAPTPLVHDLSIDGDDDGLVDSDEENKGQNYDSSLTKKRKLVKQSSQRHSQSKLIKTNDVIGVPDEVEKEEEVLLSQGDDLFFTDHTPIKAGVGVRANKRRGGGAVDGDGTKRQPLLEKTGNTDGGSESESDVGEKKASPWARRRAGGRGQDLSYLCDLVHSDSDNDDDGNESDDGVVEEKVGKKGVKGAKGKKHKNDEEVEEEIEDGDDEFEQACQSKKGKKRKGKQATSSSSTSTGMGVASLKATKTASNSSVSTSGKVKDTKGDREQGLVSLGKKIIVFAHHQVGSVF